MHQYQGGARKSPARSHPSRSTDATDSADSSTNTPEQHDGRICVPHAPEYLEKFREIIKEEEGILEDVYALMGPWDFVALVQYPDNEAAFRALAKIGKLEVVKTETFPIEKVDLFFKTLV